MATSALLDSRFRGNDGHLYFVISVKLVLEGFSRGTGIYIAAFLDTRLRGYDRERPFVP